MQKRRIVKAWVSHSALEDMFREADRSYPCETGGVVMGYWAECANAVVIMQAIGPGPDALHDGISFVPDGLFHDMEIARIYAKSGRLHTYLGDWHSHPSAPAYLSKLDKATLKRIADYTPARAPTPIMVVLGGAMPWSLRIWNYLPSELCGFPRPLIQELRVQSW